MDNSQISSFRYNISGWLIILIHLCSFIGIPILAYRFNNWSFLFGIAFVYIGFSFGWKNKSFKIILFAVVGIFLAIYNFFDLLVAFYFICFSFGFIGIRLYRIIGLGDKTSRALISLNNPDVKQEITKEIEEEFEKSMKEKK